MSSKLEMQKTTTTAKPSLAVDSSGSPAYDMEPGTSTVIHIDPEREAAALHKFDTYLLPVSVVFLVLATLDRNNVSHMAFSPVLCDVMI